MTLPSTPLTDLRRILAVRLDNVGDVVMLTPALRLLRESFPESEITLLASAAGTRVAPMLPWIDDVMTVRPVWQDVTGALPFDPGRELALASALAGRAFDAAFVFTSFSQSPHPPAYLCAMAGIPLRIGQSKERDPGLLTPHLPAVEDGAHQTDRSLALLASVGLLTSRRDLELRIPESDRQHAAAMLHAAGVGPRERFIAAAPGASCPARRWPAPLFGETLRIVQKETGLAAFLLGSHQEAALLEEVASIAGAKRCFNLSGTSLGELAAIVERASLLLANNSGPMHIADAVRTPMAILYSGTERIEEWAPRSAPSRLFMRRVPCSPCRAFVCPFAMECLDFAPDEVAAACLHLLNATRA